MSLFPISGDKIQLTTAAVDAADQYQNGVRVSSGTPLARASTSGGAQTNNGLLMSNTGQTVYVDATAGLPANTQYCNGIPLSSAGALCISTDAVATYSNGLPMAANGAVSCVVTP
jgi:hypothetical protein